MNKILLGVVGLLFSISSIAGNKYTGTVIRVVDGDTVKISSTVFPAESNPMSLRFVDVYAPERSRRAMCQKEMQLGMKASEYLNSIIKPDAQVEFTFERWDHYAGRFNGRLYVDGKDIIEQMLKLGHLSKVYDKGQWCD